MSEQLGVGIHVNSFPIPSEAFVIEQARTLKSFVPTFLVRRQLQAVQSLDCRGIETKDGGTLKRKAFALFPGAWAWGGAGNLKDIHLIHAHFGPNGVYALPLAKRLNIPLVVTFHGFDATVSRREMLKSSGLFGIRYLLGLKRLQGEGRRFIAVSKFLEKRLLDMGFPDGRLRQHYIGVDPVRFSPIPVSERSLDIVCVGRLMEAKGISDLIKAFGQIAKKFPEANLRLVGDGPDRARFESLVADRGLEGRVCFEGVMSHVAVAELVRRAAVSVLVSKQGANGWQEAFGLASIEAAASAVPVVVSTNGGLPETVVNGESGFVVSEGDVDEIADVLTQLLSNDELRKRMGATGRARVERDFDLNRQTELLENIYREALGK